MDRTVPGHYHSTSMCPEYSRINGKWILTEESRMDSNVVFCGDRHLEAVENQSIKRGDKVILGHTEKYEEGIYMHCHGFEQEGEHLEDQFMFHQEGSRETSCACDRDNLFGLLKHEKGSGNIIWIMGPTLSFDADVGMVMQALIDSGYIHGLVTGNTLATRNLEGTLLHTALRQGIYTQVSQPNGRYNHLDVINKTHRSGSIPQFTKDYNTNNDIIYDCVKNSVPMMFTGSIHDDGSVPGAIASTYEG